jgi:2-polyprenyl-6-hydroxyphenyl methylase/3-demethylubiquinone-9 3-methyltransferase
MTSEHELFDTFTKQDWWDPKGKQAALHKINPLRFEYFKEKLGGLKGKRVLDVGCGGGVLSESFTSEGAVVTGIDLSKAAIEVAKEHAKEAGLKIDYRAISLSKLAQEGTEPFDSVVLSEVLEHTDDLGGLVRDASRLLKKGGVFLFSTINKTLMARFLAIFVAENVLGMIHPGTHEFKKFVMPSHLAGLLRENGILMEEIKGMTYDPLALKFRLSSNTSVNYLGYGVKGGIMDPSP